MELTSETISETASPEQEPEQPRFTLDSLGRKHAVDASGRYVKQGGETRAWRASRNLTYGKPLLPGVPGRSPPYKRYQAIVRALAVDAGGVDMVGAAKAQLFRRYAAAGVLAEQLEVRIARGEQFDANTLMTFATLASVQVRIASRIGVDRIPRDVLSPLEYVSERSP
jgi:hypothetical protein